MLYDNDCRTFEFCSTFECCVGISEIIEAQFLSLCETCPGDSHAGIVFVQVEPPSLMRVLTVAKFLCQFELENKFFRQLVHIRPSASGSALLQERVLSTRSKG